MYPKLIEINFVSSAQHITETSRNESGRLTLIKFGKVVKMNVGGLLLAGSHFTVKLSTTHSQGEIPTGIQPSVWPIAALAMTSESSTQYVRLLRMHSTVCQCALSVTRLQC